MNEQIKVHWKIERKTQLRRLLEKCTPNFNDLDSCWTWTGSRCASGYGKFRFYSKSINAHRAAYLIFIGKISAGLHIDHLCRNRGCINPNHLEPVTMKENIKRSHKAQNLHNKLKLQCPNNHLYSEQNTYVNRLNKRSCRQCSRERMRRLRETKKAG